MVEAGGTFGRNMESERQAPVTVKSAANTLCVVCCYFFFGGWGWLWCFLLKGSLKNRMPPPCTSLFNKAVQGRGTCGSCTPIESSDCKQQQDSSLRDAGEAKR